MEKALQQLEVISKDDYAKVRNFGKHMIMSARPLRSHYRQAAQPGPPADAVTRTAELEC
jgi:hypothetical protein